MRRAIAILGVLGVCAAVRAQSEDDPKSSVLQWPPRPPDMGAPPHDLAYYKAIYIPYAPGAPGTTAAPFHNKPRDPQD